MVPLPLNMFQRLVRTWEEVHPYNAAQVLQFGGIPDVQAIQSAWHRALTALGLGRVRVEGTTFFYERLKEAHQCAVHSVPAETSLEDYLSEALNLPFSDDNQPPFRPFLIPTADAYYLGVVYRHWVADSVSIRGLIREWCATLFDSTLSASRFPRPGQAGYWRLYGPGNSEVRVNEAILGLFRAHMRLRTVRKVARSGIIRRTSSSTNCRKDVSMPFGSHAGRRARL